MEYLYNYASYIRQKEGIHMCTECKIHIPITYSGVVTFTAKGFKSINFKLLFNYTVAAMRKCMKLPGKL